MEYDFLTDWIAQDEKLSNILIEIRDTGISVEEQAELLFCKVADLYNLPKMPSDVEYSDEDDTTNEDSDYELTSVFEELGLLKLYCPEEDIITLVLLALYCVRNKINNDIDVVFEKKYGKKNKDCIGIGLRGLNSNVEALLITKGKNWVELGCVALLKPLRL